MNSDPSLSGFKRYMLIIALLWTLNSQQVFSQLQTQYYVDVGENLETLKYELLGSPLLLTPYIQNGDLKTAKNLSRVTDLKGAENVASYSGFLTVDTKYNSNMFFWFFQALNNHENAPVLLWLQGGPGASDMYGLFMETGPFYVDKDIKLQQRNYTWGTNYNLLYIDNPVGTGFSFTDADDGYSRNEEDVATNLYSALIQFFTLYSEYSNNPFFVTGESYGGKYVPSIAYKIHEENPTAELKINLKGVAIGNGLIDPVTQNDYGDYFYELGLIDGPQRAHFLQQQQQLVQYIQQGEMLKAFEIFDTLMNGDIYPYPTYFFNCTGFEYYFNFLYSTDPEDKSYLIFLNEAEVREAIHVGNATFHDGVRVELHLLADMMNSTKPKVEALIDADYKVMLYNGQLDLIVPYPLTMAMVNTMSWKNKGDYDNAERVIWKVDPKDTEMAGYVRTADNFAEVLVRDAGHMVPYDQPRFAFDLISRFVEGKGWTST